MALLYKYIYEYKGGEFIFYAASREDADRQISEMFTDSISVFLRREPW